MCLEAWGYGGDLVLIYGADLGDDLMFLQVDYCISSGKQSYVSP